MLLIQRVRFRSIAWAPLLLALALTAFGVAFVISACYDPTARHGLGREAQMQLAWWLVALSACAVTMHVPIAAWRSAAFPLYGACVLLQLGMMAARDTALVPAIKGQHNWLVVGPLRMQPSEFIKLGALLACARLMVLPGFDISRFVHVCGALAIGAFPSLLLAGEDLGGAMTFPPMVLGMLFFAGMRLRHLAILVTIGAMCIVGGISRLPQTGPKAYQYERIQAWLYPEKYALAEAYQTMRSTHSIGSGQWLGKGYAAGDQNRLGLLPEKHTDLIFAVVGEEVGFVGSAFALALFLAFACCSVIAASRCRDGFGRLLIAGYISQIMGQAAINLSVALGLMPVTGVTLPFFSYGGSSLLGCYLGLGLVLAAAASNRREGLRSSASGWWPTV